MACDHDARRRAGHGDGQRPAVSGSSQAGGAGRAFMVPVRIDFTVPEGAARSHGSIFAAPGHGPFVLRPTREERHTVLADDIRTG